MIIRHSERAGQETIFLGKGEDFPSFGFNRKACPHPSQYTSFAEWDGYVGHGYFCALCGEMLQVG